MIVPMKKVTLLCLVADQARTLEVLRELGVLHLDPVQPPASGDLQAARRELESVHGVLDLLAAVPAEATDPGQPALDLVREVQALTRQRREALADLEALRREQETLAPFGDFDQTLGPRLEAGGIFVRLVVLPKRPTPELPAGAILVVLREDPHHRYGVIVAREPVSLPGHTIPWPMRSLREVEQKIREREAELAAIAMRLASCAAGAGRVRAHAAMLEEQVRYLEARDGMGTAAQLAYLRGYLPAELVPRLAAVARREGWGLVIADPAPSDPVPTLLRLPRWARPIAALLQVIKILPGYREVDVSGVFLLFLSVFFAMIVGDAGYGLVFLLLTAAARRRWRRAPPEPFTLLFIFSVCTVLWGVVSGVYFGVTRAPGPLAALRLTWLGDHRHVMGLCLFLGAVHLTVAHVWNAIRHSGSPVAIAQLGWIGVVWTIFFVARTMLLNMPFPRAMIGVGGLGLLAVILFMTPLKRLKAEWPNHAMLPLTLMSNFGDVLSYLRLFALGVASVELGHAFNTIGATIGWSGPVRGLAAALVVFTGHALNVALSAMSVLVHGIRLNALEFSMHLGLEWSGTPYRPFARAVSASATEPTVGG